MIMILKSIDIYLTKTIVFMLYLIRENNLFIYSHAL